MNHEFVIKFEQKAWLKLYIYTNTELRKKAKTDFEKGFLKIMHFSQKPYKMWENIEMSNL